LTLYGDSPDRHSPEVATIRPDGSDLRILTKYREGKVVTPVGSYSPDGRWIAFRKRTPGTVGLWIMSPDGGNRKLIASLPFPPRFIDWGPKPQP